MGYIITGWMQYIPLMYFSILFHIYRFAEKPKSAVTKAPVAAAKCNDTPGWVNSG